MTKSQTDRALRRWRIRQYHYTKHLHPVTAHQAQAARLDAIMEDRLMLRWLGDTMTSKTGSFKDWLRASLVDVKRHRRGYERTGWPLCRIMTVYDHEERRPNF